MRKILMCRWCRVAPLSFGEASWGRTLPRVKRYGEHGHCSTSTCIASLPDKR